MTNFPANTKVKPKETGVEFTWGCSPALKKRVFCFLLRLLRVKMSTLHHKHNRAKPGLTGVPLLALTSTVLAKLATSTSSRFSKRG